MEGERREKWEGEEVDGAEGSYCISYWSIYIYIFFFFYSASMFKLIIFISLIARLNFDRWRLFLRVLAIKSWLSKVFNNNWHFLIAIRLCSRCQVNIMVTYEKCKDCLKKSMCSLEANFTIYEVSRYFLWAKLLE